MQEQNELASLNDNVTDTVPLQSMDFTDILDGIFSLYRRHLRLFLTIGAVYVVLELGIDQISTFLIHEDSALGISHITVWMFTVLCSFVVSFWVAAGLVYASAHVYLGREITAIPALQHAWRRFWPYVWSSVLCALVVVGLFITVIGIPFAIYFSVRWGLYTLPVLFEETTGRNALRRSTKLVKGSWWRVFGILLSMYLIAFMIAFILQVSLDFILSLIGFAAPPESANLLEWVLHLYAPNPAEIGWFSYSVRYLGLLSVTYITMPIVHIGSALLYFDLRIRKEAYGIEMPVKA